MCSLYRRQLQPLNVFLKKAVSIQTWGAHTVFNVELENHIKRKHAWRLWSYRVYVSSVGIFIDWLLDFCFCLFLGGHSPGMAWTSQCGRGFPWAPGSLYFHLPRAGIVNVNEHIWLGYECLQSRTPQGSLVCFMLLLGFSLPSVTFMVKSVSLYTIKCHFFWWLPGPSGWSPLHPCLSKGCCASLTLAPACHPNCLVL